MQIVINAGGIYGHEHTREWSQQDLICIAGYDVLVLVKPLCWIIHSQVQGRARVQHRFLLHHP